MKKTGIICSLLVLSIIAGCGKNAADADKTSTQTEVTENENVAKESDASESESEEAGESAQEESAEITAVLKDLSADYFTFGVGINGSTLENQTLNIPEYMELAKQQFNSCTMTNLMKSCYILDQMGSQKNLKEGNEEPALSFMSIDPTLKWCQENDMKMRGHTLVWHTQAPEWFF